MEILSEITIQFLNALAQFAGFVALRAGDALSGMVDAFILLFPPLFVAILFIFAFGRLLKTKAEGEQVVAQGVVFGLIGTTIALLYTKSGNSIIESLLPHAILILGVLFQLMGRMNKKWDVPIESHAALSGASAAAFCFLFGVLYFDSIKLPGDQ